MTLKRIVTLILFMAFLALSLLELVPKWRKAAQRNSDAVLYVRSVEQHPTPRTEKKAVSYESLLKANAKNKDG